jgi:hypothetical protein
MLNYVIPGNTLKIKYESYFYTSVTFHMLHPASDPIMCLIERIPQLMLAVSISSIRIDMIYCKFGGTGVHDIPNHRKFFQNYHVNQTRAENSKNKAII